MFSVATAFCGPSADADALKSEANVLFSIVLNCVTRRIRMYW
jgi:hypothetical protein